MLRNHRVRVPAALAVCSGLAAAAVALAGPIHGAAPAEAFSLTADFESGTTGSLSTTGNTAVVRRAAEGSFAARAITTADEAGALTWESGALEQGHRYGKVSGWFLISWSGQDESVDTFSLKNGNRVNNFDFFLDDNTGRWKWDLRQSDSAVSTMEMEQGRWYYVEALVDYGGLGGSTYTADVRINGIQQPSITSTDRIGTTVRAARFGAFDAGKSNVRYYDDVGVQLADAPLTFGAVPQK